MTPLESAIIKFVRKSERTTFSEICAALPDIPQTEIISAIVALKGAGLMEGYADGYKPVPQEVKE